MSAALTLPLDDATLARLDELASARDLTREALLRQALDNLLDDEDHAVEQITAGLAEAERGEFASEEEVERVFSRYRRE